MLWSISDFNGVLTDLKKKVGLQHLTTPRNADVCVIWQDVLGSFGDLVKAMKFTGVQTPVFVVQHGRGATSDYDRPNSYPLTSDYFLCWGRNDYDRLVSLGYGSRAKIVGCPLSAKIREKVPHREKVILFVPVNTGKEEPENIAVYYELLKIKYDKAQSLVLANQEGLKDKWGLNGQNNVSFNALAKDFDVIAKLLPWHDKNLYHGNTVSGRQDTPKNNELLFELLRNVDLVVGLDEGTTEVFAYAHDVPVIIVDGFKYRQHKENGRDYVTTDIYRTEAANHVSLNGLRHAIEEALEHPEFKREERRRVSEAELGISYGNATENIYKFIKEKVKCLSPK